MSFLSKKDALASIKKRVQNLHGEEYIIFEAYLGTNPFTKKTVRKYARTEGKIKKAISDFYTSLDRAGAAGAMLSPYQAMDAHQALELLAQAKTDLSLVECAKIALAARSTDATNKTPVSAQDAFARYEESVADKSESYRKDVRLRVSAWVAAFGADRPISEVAAPDVKKYLMGRLYRQGDVGSWVTYNNHLGNIKSFLAWCASKEQGILSENPLDCMKKLSIPYRQPKYMKAADTKGLFDELWRRRDAATGRADLAYAVLSFFCGMRQSEIERASLGESAIKINLDEKFVRVGIPKGLSKGIRPRTFVIPEQALTWMRAFDFMDGATMRNAQFRRHLVDAARAAKVNLTKNAGRHTFITMFEAVHHDANALTAIVGNTDDVRSRSYNGVELKAEGEAYFAIMPVA